MTDPQTLLGMTVVGTGGEELGPVDSVPADDTTGDPAWVVLTRAGARTAPVPLAGAMVDGTTLAVGVDAHAVKGAPHAPAESLTPDQERELRGHYGVRGDAEGPHVSGRHSDGRHERIEDDRAERDEVAAGAEGIAAGPDTQDGVPGVRRE
jgi:hypothetical protein